MSACSKVLKLALFYLPAIIAGLYYLICFYQDLRPGLQKLEVRLREINETQSLLVANKDLSFQPEDTIVIGLVACGSGHVRLSEVTVLLKSAIFFSKHPLKFVIFADKLQSDIQAILTSWSSSGKFVKIEWELRSPQYPEGADEMVSLFVPCATQRLFFPQILTEYSRILYVDTDFVFLNSPIKTWNYFKKMDEQKKSIGMAFENADTLHSLFTYAHHPSPPGGGLNSGMMLMNLEALRKNYWMDGILAINEELSESLVFGDQDILNTLLHFFSNDYLVLPCTANIRLDFCLSKDFVMSCPDWTAAVEDTSFRFPAMIHGNRGAFHDNWELWDLNFFKSYFPHLLDWLLNKNINLIRYAYHVRRVMTEQAFFKRIFAVFLQFDILNEDLMDLKAKLSESVLSMEPNDLCHEIKDDIINLIQP